MRVKSILQIHKKLKQHNSQKVHINWDSIYNSFLCERSCKNGMNSPLLMAIFLIKLWIPMPVLSIRFQSCCRYVPCYTDGSECTALFFFLLRQFKNHGPLKTSPPSLLPQVRPQQVPSIANDPTCCLLLNENHALLRLLGAWTVKQCPCIKCNYCEIGQRMKIRASCLNS